MATAGVEEVYALAADMGGMGFISSHHAEILHNNSLINIHTLDAARQNGGKRYLYTSSACIYPGFKQTDVNAISSRKTLSSSTAGCDGWEKLIAEREGLALSA